MSLSHSLSFGQRPLFVNGPQRFYQYLLAILWGLNGIVNLGVVFFSKFTPLGGLANAIVPCLIIIFCLLSAKYLIRVNSIWTWAIFFSIFFLLTATYFFGSKVSVEGIENFLPQILSSVPYVLVGAGMNYRRDFTLLTIVSWLNIITSIIYQFYFMDSGRQVSDDMMGTAYNLLPNIVICFLSAFQRRLLLSWIVGTLGVFMLFVCGTRGAVVSLLAFFALYILLKLLRGGKNIIKIAVIVGCIALICTTYFTTFFEYAAELGFGTRIYDQLMGHTEMTGSGREFMHIISISAIKEQDLFGHGIMGEQALYVGIVGKNTYPHNIILEILLQFGVLIGGIIIMMAFYLPFKAYKVNVMCGDTDGAMFVVALGTAIYMNLMFSYTFWTTPFFFFIIAFFIHEIREKKKCV